MAARISLYEAGVAPDVAFVLVDRKTKKAADGEDFGHVNPLGQVPVLGLDEGGTLTENAAILQYIAARYPSAELAPTAAPERARLHQWLSFVGTELHKGLFAPLLDPTAAPEVKAYALAKAPSRLGWVAAKLAGRELLFDHFSVADAYLFTVLNWAAVTPVALAEWPPVAAFMTRMHARPAVARAFAEERALYIQSVAS